MILEVQNVSCGASTGVDIVLMYSQYYEGEVFLDFADFFTTSESSKNLV